MSINRAPDTAKRKSAGQVTIHSGKFGFAEIAAFFLFRLTSQLSVAVPDPDLLYGIFAYQKS
jgi:hypothetical protein